MALYRRRGVFGVVRWFDAGGLGGGDSGPFIQRPPRIPFLFSILLYFVHSNPQNIFEGIRAPPDRLTVFRSPQYGSGLAMR